MQHSGKVPSVCLRRLGFSLFIRGRSERREWHPALPGAALPASPSPDLEGPSLGVRRQLRLHAFETFGILAEPNNKEASTAGDVCDVSFYPQEAIAVHFVSHFA